MYSFMKYLFIFSPTFSLRDCILDWFSGLQMVSHSRGACLHETGNKAWQRGRTPSISHLRQNQSHSAQTHHDCGGWM